MKRSVGLGGSIMILPGVLQLSGNSCEAHLRLYYCSICVCVCMCAPCNVPKWQRINKSLKNTSVYFPVPCELDNILLNIIFLYYRNTYSIPSRNEPNQYVFRNNGRSCRGGGGDPRIEMAAASAWWVKSGSETSTPTATSLHQNRSKLEGCMGLGLESRFDVNHEH